MTGGAGYIGSHMVKRLMEEGHDIVVLDDLSAGHKNSLYDHCLVVGQVEDIELVSGLLSSGDFDAIFHFSGSTSVSESVLNPAKYFINNFCASLALLGVAVKFNVKNFIFSSTAAIYGAPRYTPVDEFHPEDPINAYGESKLMFERALKYFEAAYGIRYVSLRYFNAAGADPSGGLGERHEPETHLIPLALRATQPGNQLTVYGADYNTIDGTCVRDYIHVTDLCEAHSLALGHLIRGGGSRTYNLGNGEGYSVFEIIKAIEKVTGVAVNVKHGARRQGDPDRLIADSSKIRAELGWQPKYGLTQIIKHAWAWERSLCQ
ncbi:UDP-glucose 4-epimerase GalE [Metapseudomonas otitidis]|uniref:UDP-glucose 4-epimerase GalE n=1 Tax=Metapseudomonas otitidis TaxID=319939 RepID=UPI0031331703